MKNTKILILTIFLIILFLIIIVSIKQRVEKLENFEEKKIIRKNGADMYDEFYVKIYTQIVTNQIKPRIVFEVEDFIRNTEVVKFQKVDVLDIGCGTGEHLYHMQDQMKYNSLTGVDISQAMIVSRKIEKNMLCHDIHDTDLFPQSSFSHIVCYYFTIYSLQLDKIGENVRKWLRPGGYFAIHVCDRDLFDPILDVSNPFVGISLQTNEKKRQTKSSAVFENMVYTSDFESPLNEFKVFFHEEFIFKDIIRKHTLVLNMIPVKETIEQLKKYNLKHVGTTDLTMIGYNNQYILYFQNS